MLATVTQVQPWGLMQEKQTSKRHENYKGNRKLEWPDLQQMYKEQGQLDKERSRLLQGDTHLNMTPTLEFRDIMDNRGVGIGNNLQIHLSLNHILSGMILASAKLRWQLVWSKRLFPQFYRAKTLILLGLPSCWYLELDGLSASFFLVLAYSAKQTPEIYARVRLWWKKRQQIKFWDLYPPKTLSYYQGRNVCTYFLSHV